MIEKLPKYIQNTIHLFEQGYLSCSKLMEILQVQGYDDNTIRKILREVKPPEALPDIYTKLIEKTKPGYFEETFREVGKRMDEFFEWLIDIVPKLSDEEIELHLKSIGYDDKEIEKCLKAIKELRGSK